MIGINSKERAYIKYRPSLKYETKILSVVAEDAEYKPSELIENLLNKKPSGLMGEILDLLDMNQILQDRLSKCLEDTNVNGITVEEYMKNAKSKDGNKELVRKFDKDNAMAINGTTQAECLPLLIEMEEELGGMLGTLNHHFYNNEANMDYLETAEEKDNHRIESLVKKDNQGGFSRVEQDTIGIDSMVLEATSRRLANCKNMTKQMNGLLCTTVNTYYNGNVDDVVHKFGEANVATLKAINESDKISFRKTAKLAEDDALRNKKLNSPTIKSNITELFGRIAELKQKSNTILDWALSIDTDFDQNSYTQIVADCFDQVEFLNEEYEKASLELFKQIKLDEIVKNDMIDTMQEKRFARQKIALISDIVKEKESNTFDPTEFVNSRGLRNPGTLCSK